MHEIEIVHTIDAAHRVLGHLALDGSPGKCARLHGHTYSFTITLQGEKLDETGFIVDFGVIKALLDEWDHKTLLWSQDPIWIADDLSETRRGDVEALYGVVRLPFNPTAENMARHIAEAICQRFPTVDLAHAAVKETAKTTASYSAVQSRS